MNAELQLCVASYNVLSLNGAAFATDRSAGLAYAAGRPAMLASSLADCGVVLAFLQETRTQEGVLTAQDFVRFCSGCERGHLGVEIWIRESFPLVTRQGKALTRLCRDACTVLHRDPRRLLLHFLQGELRLYLLSLHAPHRGHPEEDIRLWWHATTRLCAKYAGAAPLLLGGDFNACVGSVCDSAISDAGAEVQDFSGTFLHDLVHTAGVWLPATWAEAQVGDGWTFFQRRNAAPTRPDFVALPNVWRYAQVRTWVDPLVNAGQACVDHLATIVRVYASLPRAARTTAQRRPRVDAVAIRAPQNKHKLQEIFAGLPQVPWGTSADTHAALLVRHLQQALEQEFPRKRRPRKQYLTQSTWALHQRVAFLRHQCVRLRAAARRHTLSLVFLSWRHGEGQYPVASEDRWFRQVSFVGAVRGEQLRQAAFSLCRQCKADRTAYLDTLADEVQANKVDGAAALQSLLQQRHKKPFTPAVLPSLRKVDGTLCGSSEEIQRRWREHFGDMEAGVACEPACLVGSAPQETWPLPGQLLDMPSPSEILSALAATQAGKAPGPDGIPGEALSSAPAAFLMPLLPLVLKLCLRGEEAVGLQGATLCPLYKQRGARDSGRVQLLSSYHAIVHDCQSYA